MRLAACDRFLSALLDILFTSRRVPRAIAFEDAVFLAGIDVPASHLLLAFDTVFAGDLAQKIEGKFTSH